MALNKLSFCKRRESKAKAREHEWLAIYNTGVRLEGIFAGYPDVDVLYNFAFTAEECKVLIDLNEAGYLDSWDAKTWDAIVARVKEKIDA